MLDALRAVYLVLDQMTRAMMRMMMAITDERMMHIFLFCHHICFRSFTELCLNRAA